ncbi:hypothetical protein Ddc_20031 [Ditylenchus destructor]|nr:hypothetical protein Ddc_20031 [Ditylenchus destructor]
MDTSVTGKKSSPPENGTNETTEQHIDKNTSDEYEDKSLNLDFDCVSDAQELDDSARLEQAIWKNSQNGGNTKQQLYKLCHTSSPISFEKNISQLYKLKFDESSIRPTTSNSEICTNDVSISEKTPNVPSRAALLEFGRLKQVQLRLKRLQQINQQILALRQEFMSKNEAKASNGMNDVRVVSGSTDWSVGGDESSSKAGIGSYMEESEIGQLAECRRIIVNTPILRGDLVVKTKRALCENKAKLQDLSDNADGSVENCNVFPETRDKLEAGNESSKKIAHDLNVTLKKHEAEKRSESIQACDFRLRVNFMLRTGMCNLNPEKGQFRSKPLQFLKQNF